MAATDALGDLPDEVRDALERDLTIDITTIGRRSGEPRRIEIWVHAPRRPDLHHRHPRTA